MGLSPFHKSSIGRVYAGQRAPGDPDPDRFSITETVVLNGFTIASVHYPDCTTFEGNKIMVYEGDVTVELMSAKRLDPHFSETGLSPVARFPATKDGLYLARCMTRRANRL